MAKRIIALNIGSSQLTMGEFVLVKGAGPRLVGFAVGPLGLEPGKDSDSSAYVVSTIRDIMRHHSMKPAPLYLSVSGKDIFPRYVKLPPVTTDKVDHIVFYEAQQNVPFPIEEVVWDYQLIDNEEGGKSVMLVAIKQEVVKKLTDSVEAAGLDPQIVDVAPMALYNLARFNYGNREGCTLVMDIGARSTNLVFIEGQKIFCRSIPVAGHTITQEIMKEFDLGFKEAEELKISHAFVALGGVVEGSDSPVVNRVSKTVRSVMTRLHAEVTRSINFYRSQQNGSKPSLVLLCGGSSVIPETDSFLREKLGLDVEYLNPFQSVAVSDEIPSAEVAGNMHVLGEITGLALRWAFSCPMEINLMPSELASRKKLRSRMPFFVAAAAALFLSVVSWWGFTLRMRATTSANVAKVDSSMRVIDGKQTDLDKEVAALDRVKKKADDLLFLVGCRTRWLDLFADVRSSLVDGMWVTCVEPIMDQEKGTVTQLSLKGMGFLDKVKDEKAVGDFAARVSATKYFSEPYKVEQIIFPTEYSLEFTITVNLREPLSFQGAQ